MSASNDSVCSFLRNEESVRIKEKEKEKVETEEKLQHMKVKNSDNDEKSYQDWLRLQILSIDGWKKVAVVRNINGFVF